MKLFLQAALRRARPGGMLRAAVTGAVLATAGLFALPLCERCAGHAQAHETHKGDLSVIHAWTRPNLPNRPMAAYMVVANDGETADRIVGAKADGFKAIELHTVETVGDVSKMLPVEDIPVPAGEGAVLEPGGLHLMLFGATEAHAEGGSFPITLVFEKAGELTVEVKVERRGGDHGHGDHGAHGEAGHSMQDTGDGHATHSN